MLITSPVRKLEEMTDQEALTCWHLLAGMSRWKDNPEPSQARYAVQRWLMDEKSRWDVGSAYTIISYLFEIGVRLGIGEEILKGKIGAAEIWGKEVVSC